MNKDILKSLLMVLTLCVIIAAAGWYVVHESIWAGLVLLSLGVLCVVAIALLGGKLRSAVPDMIFGVIDNGFLAVFTIYGGMFAGVTGAVLGGVVGNTITDGIAGVFEGYVAERYVKSPHSRQRTVATSAIGKMAGCLFGAGVVLLFAHGLG